jgi:hypothetical protein
MGCSSLTIDLFAQTLSVYAQSVAIDALVQPSVVVVSTRVSEIIWNITNYSSLDNLLRTTWFNPI